jgi:hypothetical protein
VVITYLEIPIENKLAYFTDSKINLRIAARSGGEAGLICDRTISISVRLASVGREREISKSLLDSTFPNPDIKMIFTF